MNRPEKGTDKPKQNGRIVDSWLADPGRQPPLSEGKLRRFDQIEAP